MFCSPGCEVAFLINGRCDAKCHTPECHYDYADCCEPAFHSIDPNLHTKHDNVVSFRVHECVSE